MSEIKIVVIGGSAGSFSVVGKILSGIRSDFPLPVLVCMHRLKHIRSGFAESLDERASLPVTEPYDKDSIEGGHVYLAPANYHMYVEYNDTISLSIEEPSNYCRPALDNTFTSVAQVYGEKCVGIILTGANKDGAEGLKSIADHGGVTIVQDPSTADVATMPQAALRLIKPTYVLSPQGIIDYLNNMEI
ncbi:MAG: chemotaxis protein CheB [Bacteroidales bacterium]|jgi:two-component system chemotaxis response regulator CheB|nr:chemotaxis protein CheB [Bacteroidales bacterium]